MADESAPSDEAERALSSGHQAQDPEEISCEQGFLRHCLLEQVIHLPPYMDTKVVNSVIAEGICDSVVLYTPADQVDPDRVSEQQPAKEDEDEAYGFGDNSPSQSDGSGGLWSYGSDEADDAGAPQSIQGSEPVNPVYVEEGSAEGASGDFESDVLHSLAKAQNEEGAVKEGARQQADALKEEGRLLLQVLRLPLLIMYGHLLEEHHLRLPVMPDHLLEQLCLRLLIILEEHRLRLLTMPSHLLVEFLLRLTVMQGILLML
eukprot:jgi/Tetstr1/448529/TSEL_035794.t2